MAEEKNGFNMEQLRRMGNSDTQSDHAHEMPDGSMTGGSIEGSDNTHYHEYGEDERTSMSPSGEGHTHSTPLGETSGPV